MNLKRHQGFQFRGQNNSGAFVAPSAADAATYIAPSYIRGHHLRWLMKRGRTRNAVARPASGPTSWAAMCSFALWKPAELKAAIAREKEMEKEKEANATDEEESDEDDDDDGGGRYDSEESGPIGSGHAHIDLTPGYEIGADGDMGMILAGLWGGLSPGVAGGRSVRGCPRRLIDDDDEHLPTTLGGGGVRCVRVWLSVPMNESRRSLRLRVYRPWSRRGGVPRTSSVA